PPPSTLFPYTTLFRSLLTNNATETQWFQQAARVATALCFPAGRIRFLDENGKPGAPLQGQAFLYFGKEAGKFHAAFSTFGFCVRSEEHTSELQSLTNL